MNDGALAADLGLLNSSGADVGQHNRKRCVGHSKIPKHARANKECPCKEFTYLAIPDRYIKSCEGIENDEDD